MSMKRLILQARGITRVFQAGGREVHALRRVDLALPEGDFAAILGPPGAGKSTLLRILGFLDSPTEGDLLYEGRLVTHVAEAEREQLQSNGVAYLPEGDQGVAQALARRPAVLLVDEPEERVLDQLVYLHQCGLTILLATEDPEAAACTLTLYGMRDGMIRRISGSRMGSSHK